MLNRLFFMTHFEREAPVFLRVIRAVPEARKDFRPHPRSRSCAELIALFPVEIEALVSILDTGGVDWVEPGPLSVAEAVDRWQRAVASYLDRLRNLSDGAWEQQTGVFRVEGKSAFTLPIRDFSWWVLHDLIHHRGQLSVYLRLMDEKVPAIYGSSADEKVTI